MFPLEILFQKHGPPNELWQKFELPILPVFSTVFTYLEMVRTCEIDDLSVKSIDCRPKCESWKSANSRRKASTKTRSGNIVEVNVSG